MSSERRDARVFRLFQPLDFGKGETQPQSRRRGFSIALDVPLPVRLPTSEKGQNRPITSDLRQEPGALAAHAGICAGGAG